jgi:transcriptional regulator of arginine metabolism
MPSAGPTSPREQRRHAILALVQSRAVKSQEELRELLVTDGIEVNQATLSRDLRDMALVKGPSGYALPNTTPAVPATEPDSGTAIALAHAVREWLRSAQTALNQVVLRTPIGGAQPLAIAIDRAELADVVGTIGGDDTILIITKDPAAARRVTKRLLRLKGEDAR